MDIKQLQYFIACAKAGSVSEAAKLLYTTQPSVSKAVRALENEMGLELFHRLPRGIALTSKGKEFYHYACKIVNDMDTLEQMGKKNMTKWIRISLNPSSWFAKQFVEFYNLHYEENYHFQIYTAGVRTVMERVRDYLDDVGFIYLVEQQREEFLYELSRNRLVFTPMQEIESVFYPGKKCQMHTDDLTQFDSTDNSEKGKEKLREEAGVSQKITMEELQQFRFIQNYQDEFLKPGDRQREDVFSWEDLDVAVVTNSDYIMEKMLNECDIANISGSYLSKGVKGALSGIPLKSENSRIVFGYLTRKDEEMDEELEKFIQFLGEKLDRMNK